MQSTFFQQKMQRKLTEYEARKKFNFFNKIFNFMLWFSILLTKEIEKFIEINWKKPDAIYSVKRIIVRIRCARTFQLVVSILNMNWIRWMRLFRFDFKWFKKIALDSKFIWIVYAYSTIIIYSEIHEKLRDNRFSAMHIHNFISSKINYMLTAQS